MGDVHYIGVFRRKWIINFFFSYDSGPCNPEGVAVGMKSYKKSTIQRAVFGSREMAQWAKCLLFMDEDLSSDFQHPYKAWALWTMSVTSAVGLRVGSRDRKIPGRHWLASLVKLLSSSFIEKAYLTKYDSKHLNMTSNIDLLDAQMCRGSVN
jgi:hypothetical protein